MKHVPWIFCFSLFIASCSSHHQHLLGYIEGRYVYLSSSLGGQLIQLTVQKGETVKPNQLAFKLDPEPEMSQLKAAQAQLLSAQNDLKNLQLGERSTVISRLQAQISQAKASLIYSKKMMERNEILRKTGTISQAVYDQSRSQYENDLEKIREGEANLAEAKLGARNHLIMSAQAKVDAAQDVVNQNEWMLAQKSIVIPKGGYIQDTLFRQNEFVPAGKPVISLLPPENKLLIFFVPEKNLSQIKTGETIHFTCDNCEKRLTATIDYISSEAEYTPPVIYSNESKEKLVYWVEAKMDENVSKHLHPGQPVEVEM